MRKALLVLILALLALQAAYIVYRNSRPVTPPARVVKHADEKKIDDSRAKKRSPDEVGEETIRGYVFAADGKAAGNCTVVVATYPDRDALVEQAPRSARWFERTNGAGAFTVVDLPAGRYTVLARTDRTHAVAELTLRQQGAPAEVMLLLRPSQTIRGEVVDADLNPVPDATIFPIGQQGGYGRSPYMALPATTGADGKFMFTYLPEGKWNLFAVNKDRTAHNRVISDVNASMQRIPLPLGTVLTNTPRVHGQLLSDDDERPLSRVKLLLRETEQDLVVFSTLTDSAGIFDFGPVRPGDYALTLDSDRHALPEGTRLVKARQQDAQPTQDLRAVRAGRVRGRVVDASGRYGIEGVWVRAVSTAVYEDADGLVVGAELITKHERTVATDRAGYYNLQGLAPRGYRITVTDKRNPALRTRGEDPNPTLMLSPGATLSGPEWTESASGSATISGQVVDDSGHPVADAGVRLRYLPPDIDGGLGLKAPPDWDLDTRTNADGTFLFASVDHHWPVKLRAEKRGAMSTSFGPEAIAKDGIENLTLTLEQPALGAITGRVVRAEGAWPGGARVFCHADAPQNGEVFLVETDALGNFTFVSLTPGPYRLVTGDTQLRVDLGANEIKQDLELRLP